MKQRFLRPVWAEISLGNFRKNLEAVANLIQEKTRILAVVKANAYGIGAIEASRVALTVPKVAGLAVATPEEALELRDAGIESFVLVLGPCNAEATRALARADVSLTVTNTEGIRAAQEASAALGKVVRVHVKVDTGMGRVGFRAGEELDRALSLISASPGIAVEGVFTHFAAADVDPDFTRQQMDEFERAVDQVKKWGINPKFVHAANSAATLASPRYHLDLVRPGIMLYGSYPDPSFSACTRIYPVLSLYARISHIKRVQAGTYIGYGCTYRTPAPTTIATIPIGYADGYPRLLSNSGSVLIRGRRYPIVGRVCMDQLMIDLGDQSDVGVGEKVTLIGSDGEECISVDEVAALAQTIPHEILTGISQRVPRLYVCD